MGQGVLLAGRNHRAAKPGLGAPALCHTQIPALALPSQEEQQCPEPDPVLALGATSVIAPFSELQKGLEVSPHLELISGSESWHIRLSNSLPKLENLNPREQRSVVGRGMWGWGTLGFV